MRTAKAKSHADQHRDCHEHTDPWTAKVDHTIEPSRITYIQTVEGERGCSCTPCRCTDHWPTHGVSLRPSPNAVGWYISCGHSNRA